MTLSLNVKVALAKVGAKMILNYNTPCHDCDRIYEDALLKGYYNLLMSEIKKKGNGK